MSVNLLSELLNEMKHACQKGKIYITNAAICVEKAEKTLVDQGDRRD
jgi:hypothetical protein